MRNAFIVGFAAAAMAATMSGCSQQTMNQAQQDMKHDVAVANQKANEAAQQLRPEAQKLQQKIQPQAQKLDLGARVTAALAVNANLPHTIRVDASTDGVRLRGKVKTAQQKQLAGQIAQQTVPAGKKVQNQLVVGG